MTKISILTLSLLITTFFIGCGGGGGSSSNPHTAVVTCGTTDATTNLTWTTVSSGNKVTVAIGTELLWKQTTIKQVCVKSGTGSAEVN